MNRAVMKARAKRRGLDLSQGARRSSRRWPLHASVKFTDPSPASGVALNLSDGGFRVAVDQPLTLGESCTAQIETDHPEKSIEQAEVVWVRELPEGWLVGLRFIDTK